MKQLLLLTLLFTSTVQAGTIFVPKGMPTINSAINTAVNGDTILVSPGTYYETINMRGKAITIESTHGKDVTVIDAQELSTCVMFTMGETTKSILRGFTLTGGIGALHEDGRLGGGIFLHGSSPTIDSCAILNNHAEWGGGLHNLQSSPHIINCTFEGNVAVYNGGGMRSHDWSEPTIDTCTFTNNFAQFGGAMDYAADSVPSIINCELVSNGAYFQAGAIYVGCDCSSPNVSSTTMCWNVPEHIVGGWNDNGNNNVCEVCEADVSRDGEVNVTDLLEIISAWGPGACVQDITGEGGVDVQDLLIVIAAWGPCE